MRRLYKQIYLTIVASLLLVVLLVGLLWRFAPHSSSGRPGFALVGELIAPVLPPTDADGAAQQRFLTRIGDRLNLDLALFDKDRRLVAAAGGPLPGPGRRATGGWVLGRGGPAWAIRLPDDRWLVARTHGRRGPPVLGIIGFLGAIVLAVAVCAYPLVRHLTRRLERLQAGVDQLGAGDLSARVNVEGKDEVAKLAASFNRAAARIEDLVGSHKLLLANASHELTNAAVAHPHGCGAPEGGGRPETQGRPGARHRRAGRADRRHPAVEPPRRREGSRPPRGDRPAGARGRGGRPLRALHRRRRARDGVRRPHPPAAHHAQPDRERRAPRRPAGGHRGESGDWQWGRARQRDGQRPRPRRRARRPRARLPRSTASPAATAARAPASASPWCGRSRASTAARPRGQAPPSGRARYGSCCLGRPRRG